jgi:hypothetical protein
MTMRMLEVAIGLLTAAAISTAMPGTGWGAVIGGIAGLAN